MIGQAPSVLLSQINLTVLNSTHPDLKRLCMLDILHIFTIRTFRVLENLIINFDKFSNLIFFSYTVPFQTLLLHETLKNFEDVGFADYLLHGYLKHL